MTATIYGRPYGSALVSLRSNKHNKKLYKSYVKTVIKLRNAYHILIHSISLHISADCCSIALLKIVGIVHFCIRLYYHHYLLLGCIIVLT